METFGTTLRGLVKQAMNGREPGVQAPLSDDPDWVAGRDPLPESAICSICGGLIATHPAVIAALAAKHLRYCPSPCRCNTPPDYRALGDGRRR